MPYADPTKDRRMNSTELATAIADARAALRDELEQEVEIETALRIAVEKRLRALKAQSVA